MHDSSTTLATLIPRIARYRDEFYTKLRARVEQYHFPVLEFQEHDEDPAFLIKHQSHLTAKGWAYYDRALDDFYHDRLPRR